MESADRPERKRKNGVIRTDDRREGKVDGDAMGRRVIDIDGRCEAERRDAGFLSSVHKKVAVVQPSKNSFARNIF